MEMMKRKDNARNQIVNFRTDAQGLENLKQAAKDAGKPLSAYLHDKNTQKP